MTDRHPAEQKIAEFVLKEISPSISKFASELTDSELHHLLSKYKTMQLDLRKDLTEESNRRKIDLSEWHNGSPLDDILSDK